jgi:hypothetical protein
MLICCSMPLECLPLTTAIFPRFLMFVEDLRLQSEYVQNNVGGISSFHAPVSHLGSTPLTYKNVNLCTRCQYLWT